MLENRRFCRRESCSMIGQRVVYRDAGRVDGCADHEINRILWDKSDVTWFNWRELQKSRGTRVGHTMEGVLSPVLHCTKFLLSHLMLENRRFCRRESCSMIGQRVVYRDAGRVDGCADHEIYRILWDKSDVTWFNWRELQKSRFKTFVAMKLEYRTWKCLFLGRN